MEKPQYQTFILFLFNAPFFLLDKQNGRQSPVSMHHVCSFEKLASEWALAETSQATAVMHY